MIQWFNNFIQGRIATATLISLSLLPINGLSSANMPPNMPPPNRPPCPPPNMPPNGPHCKPGKIEPIIPPTMAHDPIYCIPEDNYLFSERTWCWIGGAVLGAAAGAATGSVVSGRRGRQGFPGQAGPRGPAGTPGATGPTGAQGITGPAGAAGAAGAQGATGPTGPAANFPVDTGQTLTFNTDLDTTSDITGTSATPFVTLPDGVVLEGPTISPLAAGTNTFAPIIVSPPEFGSYTVGVQITSGTTALAATITTTGTASRDGSITTILNGATATTVAGDQAQTAATFVYGAPPVP